MAKPQPAYAIGSSTMDATVTMVARLPIDCHEDNGGTDCPTAIISLGSPFLLFQQIILLILDRSVGISGIATSTRHIVPNSSLWVNTAVPKTQLEKLGCRRIMERKLSAKATS